MLIPAITGLPGWDVPPSALNGIEMASANHQRFFSLYAVYHSHKPQAPTSW